MPLSDKVARCEMVGDGGVMDTVACSDSVSVRVTVLLSGNCDKVDVPVGTFLENDSVIERWDTVTVSVIVALRPRAEIVTDSDSDLLLAPKEEVGDTLCVSPACESLCVRERVREDELLAVTCPVSDSTVRENESEALGAPDGG